MIDELRKVELEYVRCFSEKIDNKKTIRFYDENLEDIYATNITIINNEVSTDEVKQIISKEIKNHKKEKKEFLIIEFQDPIKKESLLQINTKPTRVDKLDYMYIVTDKYKELFFNKDCEIKALQNEVEFNDAIKMSILENTPVLGVVLATFKIRRKVEVYKDIKNNLISFLCYYNERPIGSFELLIHNKTAKIEDFGVLEKYRGRGFGKSILRYAIKFAKDKGAEVAYVITESEDTAKEMYKKCGFLKCGEKTQVIYDFY